MNRAKRVRFTYKFCPHCEKECNIKTYKEHKRLFFNPDLKTWYSAQPLPEKEVHSDSDSLFSFPDDSDEGNDCDKQELDNNEVSLGSDESLFTSTSEFIHAQSVAPHTNVQYLLVNIRLTVSL